MKTRAALLREPGGPLDVREVELEEPGPHDVIVRIAAAGVCGSDLHVLKGEWPRPMPIVLGHEGAGVVEQVGSEVESVRPGDRVVLSWAPACGTCGPCRRGRPAACEPARAASGKATMLDGTTRLALEGETVYRMIGLGALAERVLVPASLALPLPESVPLDQAALLGCAALTGVGAVLNAARLEPGSTALVIGAGGVGQFVVQGCRLAGAARIVVVDPVEGRREAALRVGAAVAVSLEELPGAVGEGADYTFDAVGLPETTQLALRRTRGGGTVVLVGMPAAGARLDLDPFDFTNREKHLTGTIYGSEDPAVGLPKLLEHVGAGRIELAALVGPSYPLERVNEAFAASLAGSPGRVVVTP